MVLWDVTPCSAVEVRRGSRGTHSLSLLPVYCLVLCLFAPRSWSQRPLHPRRWECSPSSLWGPQIQQNYLRFCSVRNLTTEKLCVHWINIKAKAVLEWSFAPFYLSIKCTKRLYPCQIWWQEYPVVRHELLLSCHVGSPRSDATRGPSSCHLPSFTCQIIAIQ
jgi:hypothetical protein